MSDLFNNQQSWYNPNDPRGFEFQRDQEQQRLINTPQPDHSLEAIVAGALIGRAMSQRARPLTPVQHKTLSALSIVGWVVFGFFCLFVLMALVH